MFNKLTFRIVIIFFAFYGCKSSDKQLESVECPTKNNSSSDKSNINEINIYLDVSGSMKGLLSGGKKSSATEFQQNVPQFLARIRKDWPQVKAHFFLIKNAKEKFEEIDYKDAIDNRISDGNISNWGGTTYIPDMLDSIISTVHNNGLNILITDGIYSPENRNETDQSKRKIYEVINNKISTSIFAFTSNFIPEKGAQIAKSPYYFFAFGQSHNIKQIRKIITDQYGDNYKQIEFGLQNSIPFYSIIPWTDNSGSGEPVESPDCDNRYFGIANIDFNKDVEFWLGIDLSEYPAFLTQESGYLMNNLNITSDEIKQREKKKFLSKEEFMPKVSDVTDKKLSILCTYFIKIRLSEMEEKSGELSITLNKTRPNWVGEYSHSIKDSADTKRDQTYMFTDIISGIEQAYKSDKKENYFQDLKIKISKN